MKVCCVRPSCFGYNEDTAATNSFQCRVEDEAVGTKAVAEFDAMMESLEAAGIEVVVVQDVSAESEVKTPDSVFPNNWFSTHLETGEKLAVLYPMCGVNRRAERMGRARDLLAGYKLIDMTGNEAEGKFLEGTGSLVLDRTNRVCYAAISPRTHPDLVKTWCETLGYTPVTFTARRTGNQEVLYHTNVLMANGPSWVVCCLDMIPDAEERAKVRSAIAKTGKTLIELSEDQIDSFCGNVLNVPTKNGGRVTVMSTTAERAFKPEQLKLLEPVCAVDIPTIETVGGGSARCMLAEFLL